ncbi:hypothetical protein EJ08DRAFT_727705 [Tothia fuscella]|uniref:Uncharacterized protein n=1 Tax=Tothia fuscella TaxID=1048955 RepID=A0A9P4NGR1_9PEZI|nr:hypothetical protein EJ08DRAFT_727705 [Tothia fuscella]
MGRYLLFCIAEEAKPLKVDETLDADWIGATEQDCQKWTLENQSKVNFIEQDIIAIANTRSAEDERLSIQYYGRQIDDLVPLEFPGFGLLPQEYNVWYDFRVDSRGASEILARLGYVALDVSFPRYFGREEELTDERGIFDVAKAVRSMLKEGPDTPPC